MFNTEKKHRKPNVWRKALAFVLVSAMLVGSALSGIPFSWFGAKALALTPRIDVLDYTYDHARREITYTVDVDLLDQFGTGSYVLSTGITGGVIAPASYSIDPSGDIVLSVGNKHTVTITEAVNWDSITPRNFALTYDGSPLSTASDVGLKKATNLTVNATYEPSNGKLVEGEDIRISIDYTVTATTIDGNCKLFELDFSKYGAAAIAAIDGEIASLAGEAFGDITIPNTGGKWYIEKTATSGVYNVYMVLDSGASGAVAFSGNFEIGFDVEFNELIVDMNNQIEIPITGDKFTIEYLHDLAAEKTGEIVEIKKNDGPPVTHDVTINWEIEITTTIDDEPIYVNESAMSGVMGTVSDIKVYDATSATLRELTVLDGVATDASTLARMVTIDPKAAGTKHFIVKFTETRTLAGLTASSISTIKNTATVEQDLEDAETTAELKLTAPTIVKTFSNFTHYSDGKVEVEYHIDYKVGHDTLLKDIVFTDKVTSITGGYTGKYRISSVLSHIGTYGSGDVGFGASPSNGISVNGTVTFKTTNTRELKAGETLRITYKVMTEDTITPDQIWNFGIKNTVEDHLGFSDTVTYSRAGGVIGPDTDFEKIHTNTNYGDKIVYWRINVNSALQTITAPVVLYEVLPAGLTIDSADSATFRKSSNYSTAAGAASGSNVEITIGAPPTPTTAGVYREKVNIDELLAAINPSDKAHVPTEANRGDIWKITIVPEPSDKNVYTISLFAKFDPDTIVFDPESSVGRTNFLFSPKTYTKATYGFRVEYSKDVFKPDGVVTQDENTGYTTILWGGQINIMGRTMGGSVFSDKLQLGKYADGTAAPAGDGIQTYKPGTIAVYEYTGEKLSTIDFAPPENCAPHTVGHEGCWTLIDSSYYSTAGTTPTEIKVEFNTGYRSKNIHYIAFETELQGAIMPLYTNEFKFNKSESKEAKAVVNVDDFATKSGEIVNYQTRLVGYDVVFNRERDVYTGTITIEDDLASGSLTYEANSAVLYRVNWNSKTSMYDRVGSPIAINVVTTAPLKITFTPPAGYGGLYMLSYNATVRQGAATIVNTVDVKTTVYEHSTSHEFTSEHSAHLSGGGGATFGGFTFEKLVENSDKKYIPIKGATFSLRRSDGRMIGGAASVTATSDDNGLVVFGNIGTGVYILTETSAPSGYARAAAVTVRVSYENGAWEVDIISPDGLPVIEKDNPDILGGSLNGDAAFGILNTRGGGGSFPDPTPTPEETPGGETPEETPEVTPEETPEASESPDPSETPEGTETPEVSPPETTSRPEPEDPEIYVPEEYEVVDELRYVEYEDGYIVMDGDLPLGSLHWDEELEEWVFDEDIPLGFMTPQTGDTIFAIALALVMLASAVGAALVLTKRRRHVK